MRDNITTYCHNSKLQLFFITLVQNIADLTSMQLIHFCTATLVYVHRMTNIPYTEHKN